MVIVMCISLVLKMSVSVFGFKPEGGVAFKKKKKINMNTEKKHGV